MKRVIVVQARMASTRLPGKVLSDLNGRPLLGRQLDRLRRCRRADELCIATTTSPADDALAAFAAAEGVPMFRGDEADVLSRYAGAAAQTRADLVVRITADCPLIDPDVTDAVIERATQPDAACDYVSNVATRRFPRGLDTEVVFADVLQRVARLATSRPAREHVTWFIHTERPELFVRREVIAGSDDSDLRFTVDTSEDLAAMRALWAAAGDAPLARLVEVARAHPEIVALNAGVAQKPS